MFIGNLKSLRLLWTNLATNHRYRHLIQPQDILEFEKRVENEGLTFLTQTLPLIGKSLDEFHSTQVWNPPIGFKLSKGSDRPLFMRTAINAALAGQSPAVDCVRQLTYIFYKLEVEYDQSTVAKFTRDFIDTDHEISLSGIDSPGFSHAELVQDMKLLIGRILCNLDPQEIRPYHGSGATACRTRNYDKWHQFRYIQKLDEHFPYADFFFFSPSHLADEYYKLERSEEVSTPKARIVFVPKDSRGPRVISCEPAEHMFIQQGLMRVLYQGLETHPLTRGQINFIDQSTNRELARQGSLSDDLATLDLSEASDRVSWKLVRTIFPQRWVESLDACRSTITVLPDGTEVELNKFAPMGSACCFPVEALVFWTCASSIIRRLCGRSTHNVYVYGDDIIIPSAYAAQVIEGLELIGLKVNHKKSFLKGPFRESCGGDYHLGGDVTPVRIRKFLSDVGTGLATSSDLANSFIAKFGEIDAEPLLKIIEDEVGYIFPRTLLPLPVTVRLSPSSSNDVFFRRRWNKNLQRFEHRVLTLETPQIKRRLPSWSELLRRELGRGRQRENYGRESNFFLENQGRVLDPGFYAEPYSARKKWAWAWLG